MRFTFFALMLASMLFSCGDKASEQKTDVYEIRNIGLLSTTEFTIGKVIKLQDDKAWYKYGDRKILISCKARIKAGVDLSKITKDDITVKGSGITVDLPGTEILSLDMDPNLIRTEMEDINGFRQQFTQQEKNKILVLGEQSIRRNIGETSILSVAQKNAEIFVKDFYKQLGFENVVVNFKQPYVSEIKTR